MSKVENMRVIKITQEHKNQARRIMEASRKCFTNSIYYTTKESMFYSFCGEVVTLETLGLKQNKLSELGSPYDAEYNGVTFDVKTKRGNGQIQQDWEFKLRVEVLDKCTSAYLLFCYINKLTDECSIVGLTSLKAYRRMCKLVKKGELLDSGHPAKYDSYNIPVNMLTEIIYNG